MFKLPVSDPVARTILAREIIHDGRRRGLALSFQHLRILEMLLGTCGAIGSKMLGRSIGSRSRRPSRLLGARMPPLRKAVAPYGYRINTYRNLGYAIVVR